MARSKSRPVSRTTQRPRDLVTSTIATPVRSFIRAVPVVSDFEFLPGADRRRFHFERKLLRPLPAMIRGRHAQIARGFPAARQYFKDPRKVLVCARRKERREVLFALNRRGRGGGGRRTPLSNIQCRRT